MGSAFKAEVRATYVNTQEDVPTQMDLIELNHLQPLTPIQVDNTTYMVFYKETIKQKLSKSIDMRFYWIQDHK